MKRLFFLGLMLVVCVFSTQAQFGYYNDALQFSRTNSIGTARTQALGGAQVALGGDINSAYANPAGLGFNRSSVVTFTPSINFYNSESEYFGELTDDYKANFNIANLGVIFNFANSDIETSKFKGGSFAITVTRENNFHSDIRYDGFNTTPSESGISRSSIVESWLDQAWGTPVDQLGNLGIVYDAYNHYLINDFVDPNEPNGYNKFIGDFPRQIEVLTSKGSQYQWDFAAGGNYDDILYFGASLSINSIRYTKENTYTESEFLYNNAPDDAINEVSTRTTLDVRGTGISGTFGLIARPADFLRIGVSATTPTYYGMREESSEDLFTSYNNWEYAITADSSIVLQDFYDEYFSESSYNITTPFKLTTGAAFFLGKHGFISADVDFIDYSSAKLKSSDFNVSEDNQTIKSLYQNTINFRVGSEIRLDAFRLRGGYSYEGDPYLSSGIDNSIKKISAGLGYRNQEFFVDVSAVHSKWNTARSPYTIYSFDDPNLNISPTAFTENKNLNVSVTFGVNF
ncbi:MAG: hypothetical protein ABJF04_19755 [Reichenbachiella sp.]|uniref:OmpP1/FadL family transporter n=1 Tax=Reichenbachiella sp. TaxID=2184521 RepID=UPI003265371E